jgi:hypothetical protein
VGDDVFQVSELFVGIFKLMCVFLSLWFTFGSLCEVRHEVFVQILFTFW